MEHIISVPYSELVQKIDYIAYFQNNLLSLIEPIQDLAIAGLALSNGSVLDYIVPNLVEIAHQFRFYAVFQVSAVTVGFGFPVFCPCSIDLGHPADIGQLRKHSFRSPYACRIGGFVHGPDFQRHRKWTWRKIQ